jgi:hypothetical protein
MDKESSTSDIMANTLKETFKYLFNIKNSILPIKAGRKLEIIMGSTVKGIPFTRMSSVKNPNDLKM